MLSMHAEDPRQTGHSDASIKELSPRVPVRGLSQGVRFLGVFPGAFPGNLPI